jgi:hypothetical protein
MTNINSNRLIIITIPIFIIILFILSIIILILKNNGNTNNKSTNNRQLSTTTTLTWTLTDTITTPSQSSHAGQTMSVNFNGTFVMFGGDDTLLTYDITTSAVTSLGSFGDSSVGFGSSALKMSQDGLTFVAGESLYDGTHGCARVFTRISSTSKVWTQPPTQTRIFPNDAVGYSKFGSAVAISDNGQIIVIAGWLEFTCNSAIWFFARNSTTGLMNQLGPKVCTYAGYGDLAMSGDGNVVAVPASGDYDEGNNNGVYGSVRIFVRDGSNYVWNMTQRLRGTSAFVTFGSGPIALSNDASVLAIGTSGSASGTLTSGCVIYHRVEDGSNTYTMSKEFSMSDSIVAVTYPDDDVFRFGGDKGQVLVIGRPWIDSNRGHVQIIDTNTNVEIKSLVPDHYSQERKKYGRSVAASRDGKTIVIGQPDVSGSGGAEIYRLQQPSENNAGPDTGNSPVNLGVGVIIDIVSGVIAGGVFLTISGIYCLTVRRRNQRLKTMGAGQVFSSSLQQQQQQQQQMLLQQPSSSSSHIIQAVPVYSSSPTAQQQQQQHLFFSQQPLHGNNNNSSSNNNIMIAQPIYHSDSLGSSNSSSLVSSFSMEPPRQYSEEELWNIPLPSDKKYHAFLSHAWGRDGVHHTHVREMANLLRGMALSIWFDEERLSGDIDKQISDGLESSLVFISFINTDMIQKIANAGSRDGIDWCDYEFSAALLSHGKRRTIVVVSDPSCRNPAEWYGPVKTAFSSVLHIDYSDASKLESAAHRLRIRIKQISEAMMMIGTGR